MKTPPGHAIILAVGTSFCAAIELDAATRIKADNADNLNLTPSWTTSLLPGGSDVAQFDSTITGPLLLSLGADTAWSQINYQTPGGDIFINAGNTLTLSNNTPIIFGASTTNLTLNCDVNFAGAAFTSIRSPAGQTLTFGGVIDGRDVTVTLGNSAGTIRLSNPNTVRIGSIVQVNTAGMKLGIGASTVGDPVTSGPLGTNLFTWAASAATTELFTYNGNQTLANPVRIQASPLNFNSADDLTLSGVVDLNNGNRTLNVVSMGILRVTGTISNDTGIVKTGPGTLELGGTNVGNFNSGLSIYGGTVRLLASDVIPDGPGRVFMTNQTEVLDLNGFSDTVAGLIGSGGLGIWNGTLDNTAPGTTSVLTLGNQFTYNLTGNLQNSGSGAKLALVKVGTGGLTISNANTFNGGLTNASAGKLYLNSQGAAGQGPVSLADPDAQLLYSGGGSIAWTNDIILEAGTQPVIGAVDGSAVEVAGVIGGPGLLYRAYNFSEQGPLKLSGDNTFTGGLFLYGGDLTLGHPRALGLGTFYIGDPVYTSGSIYVVPGIDLSGPNAITNDVLVQRDFTVGGTNAIEFAGPVVWITNATQRTINVTNPAGLLISGPMSGYGFNKVGQGLLTLDAVCSHSGPSTISVGPLAVGPSGSFTGPTTILLGGSGVLDVSAAPGFTIDATQTLSGYGRIAGDVTVDGAMVPGGVIFTMTVSNNLTLGAGSTTTMQLSRTVMAPEKIICLGTLACGGNLVVNNVGQPLQAGDTFDLLGFTGNPGSFATVTLPALDAGLAWNTDNLYVNGVISVVSTATPPTQLINPALLDSTSFVMTATGGTPNASFRVWTQTNAAEPMSNWDPVSTNSFDGSGALTVTNAVNSAEPQRLFRISEP